MKDPSNRKTQGASPLWALVKRRRDQGSSSKRRVTGGPGSPLRCPPWRTLPVLPVRSMLRMRRMLIASGNGFAVSLRNRDLVAYYANSIAHLLGPFESAVRQRDSLPTELIAVRL